MATPIFQVDAFTDQAFGGNPAAVCILAEPAEAGWMQKVAAEMNLSETAFLHRDGDGYGLRWFTPTVEVDLCGHATLASAHVLWQAGYLKPGQPARFFTRSGQLTAARNGDEIELDFPALSASPSTPPPGLLEGLSVQPRYVGKGRFDYLLELETADEVRRLQPDFRKLAATRTRGIIVTARSDGAPYDFVSRFFAPATGIDEDPVTGSAHCCLGPYWQRRLGKAKFLAFQASARGGILRVEVAGERVLLGGRAVTVLRGELL